MAANPNIPPQTTSPQRDRQPAVPEAKQFPWPMVAAIIVIICLAVLAYYWFH